MIGAFVRWFLYGFLGAMVCCVPLFAYLISSDFGQGDPLVDFLGIALAAGSTSFSVGLIGGVAAVLARLVGGARNLAGLVFINVALFISAFAYLSRNGFGPGHGSAIIIVLLAIMAALPVVLVDLLLLVGGLIWWARRRRRQDDHR